MQDTVTLNADNGWTYTWKELTATYEGENGEKKSYTYTVHEANVASGYTVAVSQQDTAYTVTNTYAQTPAVTPDKTLPYTGTLTWPIPVLTIAGLLLIGTGWYLFSRRKER